MSRFSKAGVAGDSDLKKQLKIKTGTLKRLSAELKMYTTEKLQVEAKLEKLNAAESDAHDRKKAEEMVQESVQVLATTRTNVIAAHDAMNAFLAENAAHVDLAGTEELATAQQLLLSAEQLLAA